MIPKTVLLAGLSLWMGTAALGADAGKEMMDAIQNALPAVPVEEIVQRGGYPEEMQPLVQDYMKEMIGHISGHDYAKSVIALEISRDLPSELSDDTEVAPAAVKAYAAGVLNDYASTLVLFNLPAQDARRYFKMDSYLFSDQDLTCVEIAQLPASERHQLEIEQLGKEPEQFQKEWFDLRGRAVATEMQLLEEMQQVATDYFEAADAAYTAALEDLVTSHPNGKRLALGLTGEYDDLAEMENHEHCELGALQREALLTIEEIDRKALYRYFGVNF